MIELRPIDYSVDDEYDSCGNTAIAVLELNDGAIKIVLCEECVNELIETIRNFTVNIYCKDCRHWYCSKSGARYGGTCEVKLAESGMAISDISESSYGYVSRTEFMDTCGHSESKYEKSPIIELINATRNKINEDKLK